MFDDGRQGENGAIVESFVIAIGKVEITAA